MIKVEKLSMRYGAKELFKNLSLQFNPGCRYGLVGANGSGKSTFLKILLNEITAETGDVYLPTQFTIGSLGQDHYKYENELIVNVVIRGDTILWDVLEKKNRLIESETFTDDDAHELAECENVIAERGGYMAASEAAKLLEGLGINEKVHNSPLHVLSGGYKLRVLLAQVLFRKPNILILDEPTNHLDLYSIKWLENYLKVYPGTLIVSSHDRDFLNQVCSHIVDVDYGTMKIYSGNFNDFVRQKQEEKERKEAVLSKQEKRCDDLEGFIDRFGAKASKAKQAQSKARLVEKLRDEMEALDIQPSSRIFPRIEFNPSRASGVIPLVVKDVCKSYGTKKVLENVHLELERGDRLAIIGPNGIGKSSFLEILTENIASDSGTIKWGHGVIWAYFPQDHHREVQGKHSLLEWLGLQDRSMPEEKLRDHLGRVLFSGDAVHQTVHTLSGGETARLILAKLMMKKPNLLIFDEPTNHLDMEAIDELIKSMQGFDGTIILVSHNRYFVSSIATRILEITPTGVFDHRCTFDEYLSRNNGTDHLSSANSLKQRNKEATASPASSSISYEEQKKLKSQALQNKKRVSDAEAECTRIEKSIRELDHKMSSEKFFQNSSREEQVSLAKQKKDLEDKLQKALENWEQLSLQFG